MAKLALDTTDIRILSALQSFGPLSKVKLAQVVNLSPTPCWARLDRLKKTGIIRGYHANIALNMISDVTKVIVTLSLTNHRKSDFERFENYINNLSEVTECIATGGGTDYVMKVVTRNLECFQDLMETMLNADLGIERYMTYIVTREVKASHPDLVQLAQPK